MSRPTSAGGVACRRLSGGLPTGIRYPSSIDPNSDPSRAREDWCLFHPVYAPDELMQVKIVRHEPKDISDRIVAGLVKLIRFGFDTVTRYKHLIEHQEKSGKSLSEMRKSGLVILSGRALTKLEGRNVHISSRRHRRSVDATQRISRRTPLLDGDVGNLINDVLNTFGQDEPNGCSGKEMEYSQAQAATSDSFQTTRCHRYDHTLGNTAWSTAYNWRPTDDTRTNQVKSYSNAGWAGTPVQISALKKFETTWKWSYADASQDLVSDVLWLLARGGALPAGSMVDNKTVPNCSKVLKILSYILALSPL
ncbi:hypothetical protein DFH28DRAFT_1114871 [Melampsora americana]|nr:hypothetical protein DFH28DRAFT_1114871 [Melampsora americana]